MQTPEIAPGTVEQAIYTWSQRSLMGNKGLGFVAASPGLARHLTWLDTFQPHHLRHFEMSTSAEPKDPAWKAQAAVGMFGVGRLSVVYRKVMSAGSDAHGRSRPLVHLLVGDRNALDLSRVSEQDPVWALGVHSSLDSRPELDAIDVGQLAPREVGHACGELDHEAEELLVELLAAKRVHRQHPTAEGRDRMAVLLLLALPAALRPCIDLDWYADAGGIVSVIQRGSGKVADAPRAESFTCAHQEHVEQIWARLGERSWECFAQAYTRPATVVAIAPVGEPQEETATETTTEPLAARHERLLAFVAAAAELEAWDARTPLDDRQAGLVVSALQADPAFAGRWLRVLESAELRAALGQVGRRSTVTRIARDLAGTSTADIVTVWQTTGLAVLGHILLDRGIEADAGARWAVRADRDQLQSLIALQLDAPDSIRRLARVLAGGWARDTAHRRDFVLALQRSEVSTREFFDGVMVQAELPPKLVSAFLREHLDLFVEHYKVPEQYREPLRLATRGPRLRSLLRV